MARSWSARSRSASAAPTARSSPALMAKRRPDSERLVLGHESYGEVIEAPPRQPASPPATASSASCGGPTRCPARPAPPANGTCAATAATPNAASRACTASAPSAFASSRASPSRSIAALGDARRAARADQHRRQGLGSHRAHRPAFALLGAAAAAGDRRRPGRSAGRADGQAARLRGLCARPRQGWARSRSSFATSARSISPARSTTSSSLRPTSSSNAPARRRSSPACSAAPRRAESSACSASAAASRDLIRYRAVQPDDGAQQRRGVRLGQRQPPALRAGRESARPRRQGMARPADLAARAAVELAGGAGAPAGRYQSRHRFQRCRPHESPCPSDHRGLCL